MTKSIDTLNIAETSHILGVDFGESKIGLAISDTETKMAFAFNTLRNDNKFIENLRQIVAQKNVSIIVVGMTQHEKDQEGLEKKKQFAQTLKKEIGVEVFFQEEMFSTKIAQANIKMRGGKNLAATDDQEAARIILQEWLDFN